MKGMGRWVLVLGLLAVFLASCSASDDGPPPPVDKYFVYVANQGLLDVDGYVPGSGKISAFAFDPGSGGLVSAAGSPFAGALEASSILGHPSGKYVYVTDQELFRGNSISGYAIDPGTGSLSDVPTAYRFVPFPGSAAIDPSGKRVYVNGYGRVYAFSIDAETGAFEDVAGSPFDVSGGMAWAPTGEFAYMVGSNPTASILTCAVDPDTGALTEVARLPLGEEGGDGYAIHPSGRFLYLTDSASGAISQLSIDTATGGLTQVSGSPFSARTPPGRMAIDPSGRFAFVLNSGSSCVSVYLIDPSTGALTETVGSPFAAPSGARHLAICPSGRFAFVLGGAGMSIFRIRQDTGALAEVDGSPFVVGTDPRTRGFVVVRVAR